MSFNNAVFLSERETADRNYAMAYLMRENRCFPPRASLSQTMDLYFQTCSMEITTETLAVMGASLANGGICPLTGEKVLDSDSVRNILSLMFTCGMYNYSGQFAFDVRHTFFTTTRPHRGIFPKGFFRCENICR